MLPSTTPVVEPVTWLLVPRWVADNAVITTNSTRPTRWVPCASCSGAGGQMTSVTWAVGPVWIHCAQCRGGCGHFEP